MSKILFMIMLMLGSLISISANSWLGVWMGLEINLLSFIPLMNKKNNLNSSEATLNYFLVQAFASTVLLFSIIMFMVNMNTDFFLSSCYNYLPYLIITLTLILKMGAAPFHFWFPNVMENLSWMNSFTLMTWQKVAPMMILSYLNFKNFLIIFVLMSTLVGALGGLNQTSLRKLMAFSSINHIGWMIMALSSNENLWMIYFLLYSFLNCAMIYMFYIFQVFYLNQMYSLFMNSYFIKFSLLTNLLSLGGLPPFLGFLPKWAVIQSLMFMKLNLLTLFMIVMSLITLYYYLKISIAGFMLNYNSFNWSHKNYFKTPSIILTMNFNLFSLIGFFLMVNLTFMIN